MYNIKVLKYSLYFRLLHEPVFFLKKKNWFYEEFPKGSHQIFVWFCRPTESPGDVEERKKEA